jgi:hypothetical protein
MRMLQAVPDFISNLQALGLKVPERYCGSQKNNRRVMSQIPRLQGGLRMGDRPVRRQQTAIASIFMEGYASASSSAEEHLDRYARPNDSDDPALSGKCGCERENITAAKV